jgi:hypothetical protein
LRNHNRIIGSGTLLSSRTLQFNQIQREMGRIDLGRRLTAKRVTDRGSQIYRAGFSRRRRIMAPAAIATAVGPLPVNKPALPQRPKLERDPGATGMTNALPNLTKAQLAELSALLGEPPVLSSENAGDYNLMWQKLIECFMPGDLMELVLVRQIQNETWTIIRLHRHRTLAVERRFRETNGFLAERRKELKAKKQALAEEVARKAGQPMTEYSRLIELDDTIMSTLRDLEEIDARQPSELEHNRALEQGIVFQEHLDRLLNSAHKRRNDALHWLDLYRHGLGQHWREISDQIIIAEATEITPLPGTTEVAAQHNETSAENAPASIQGAPTSIQNAPTPAHDAQAPVRDAQQTSPLDLENQDHCTNATSPMGNAPVENAAALRESPPMSSSA